jgi:hypothetical protein
MAAFGIISQMLFWGFVRTALVGGVQSVGVVELLRTGRGYFWKMLLFQLMLFPVFLVVILGITSAAKMVLHGQAEQDEASRLLNIVAAAATSLILMKPVYFVPAQIVRKDCGIFEALLNLGQTKLLKMRFFLILAVI